MFQKDEVPVSEASKITVAFNYPVNLEIISEYLSVSSAGKNYQFNIGRPDNTAGLRTKEELSKSQTIAKLGSWDLNLNTQTITLSAEHQILVGEKPQKTSMSLAEYAEKYIISEDVIIIQKQLELAIKNKRC